MRQACSRLVSLKFYEGRNLRICRPHGLVESDSRRVIDFARARLGNRYDLRNVWDLARYLIQQPPVPNRYRRFMLGIGSGQPTRAICSSLIAEAFQAIGYPVLPMRSEDLGEAGNLPSYYVKRHFTHFTPRDFDLSPYFEIIKPTLMLDFDYRQINWWMGASESDVVDLQPVEKQSDDTHQ